MATLYTIKDTLSKLNPMYRFKSPANLFGLHPNHPLYTIYQDFVKKTHGKQTALRASLLESLEREKVSIGRIENDHGYLIPNPNPSEWLFPAVQQAQTFFKSQYSSKDEETPIFKAYPIRTILNLESPVIKLATDPKIISTIGSYIGVMPVLYSISLWYSPNHQDLPMSNGNSQFFHVDHEDKRMIKLFVNLSDVDQDCGPFCLLGASDSDKVISKFHVHDSSRLTDEQIFSCVGRDTLRTLTGNVGTMALVDTCRCLHYGSRPSSKSRLLLQFRYVSPFSADFWPWNPGWHYRNLATPDQSDYMRAVLGAF